MPPVRFDSQSEADTTALGAAVVQALADSHQLGVAIALIGPLGAGKTRLAQAIGAALGIDRETITSPTFVLVQEHTGRCRLRHIDAYRVRDEDEFEALGADEIFAGDALVLVEWADRVPRCLPQERIEVELEVLAPDARRIRITATTVRLQAVLLRLEALLLAYRPVAPLPQRKPE